MHPTQQDPTPEMAVASALVEALERPAQSASLSRSGAGVIQGRLPIQAAVAPAAVRTTGVQVMHVLGSAGSPLTLQDIADGVVAIRRDEDVPKARGGTRYQEMCRTALGRLIERVSLSASSRRIGTSGCASGGLRHHDTYPSPRLHRRPGLDPARPCANA
jgi:hypothetical protein